MWVWKKVLLADSKFYLRLILSLFLYTFSFLSKHCYTQLQWAPRHYCFVASSIRKNKSCACKLQCGTYLQPVEGKDQPALSGSLRCRTLRICWREEGGRALQLRGWGGLKGDRRVYGLGDEPELDWQTDRGKVCRWNSLLIQLSHSLSLLFFHFRVFKKWLRQSVLTDCPSKVITFSPILSVLSVPLWLFVSWCWHPTLRTTTCNWINVLDL